MSQQPDRPPGVNCDPRGISVLSLKFISFFSKIQKSREREAREGKRRRTDHRSFHVSRPPPTTRAGPPGAPAKNRPTDQVSRQTAAGRAGIGRFSDEQPPTFHRRFLSPPTSVLLTAGAIGFVSPRSTKPPNFMATSHRTRHRWRRFPVRRGGPPGNPLSGDHPDRRPP